MKTKMMILAGIAALSLSTVSALAASDGAIDTLSLITKYDKQDIVEMIENGTRPSQIALNLDVMNEFHDAMIDYRLERLNLQVENGRLTQEEADKLFENWTNNRHACLDPDYDREAGSYGGMRMGSFFGRQNKGNQ
jgi:hypothetical protein